MTNPTNTDAHADAGTKRIAPPLAYSVSQAIAIIGVGRTTFYAEVKAGRLPARKVRNRTLILAEDLAAWLRSLPAARGA